MSVPPLICTTALSVAVALANRALTVAVPPSCQYFVLALFRSLSRWFGRVVKLTVPAVTRNVEPFIDTLSGAAAVLQPLAFAALASPTSMVVMELFSQKPAALPMSRQFGVAAIVALSNGAMAMLPPL